MSSTHFDQRGATYDANTTHQRIHAALLSGITFRPGMRVLDIATGTGPLAIHAAEAVGPTGSVIGIDLSSGMLTEARRKARAANLRNLTFREADAEHADLTAAGFDLVLCGSGLIMLDDIPAALRLWATWLAASATLAFDVPAKPFGISQLIAEAAAQHGITLPYNVIADTPEKCRALLAQAGLELTSIHTEIVTDDTMTIAEATAFLDARLDHPAWRAYKQAPAPTREAIRGTFLATLDRIAINNRVPYKIAQHFVYASMPGSQ